MADINKVLKGWERCNECHKHPVGMSQAYVDCEYTVGLYCVQDKLIYETIELLKEQEDLGTELTNAVELIHKKNERIEKLLKEQEAVKPTWGRGKPFCGACGFRIRGGKFCSECGKPIAWEGR